MLHLNPLHVEVALHELRHFGMARQQQLVDVQQAPFVARSSGERKLDVVNRDASLGDEPRTADAHLELREALGEDRLDVLPNLVCHVRVQIRSAANRREECDDQDDLEHGPAGVDQPRKDDSDLGQTRGNRRCTTAAGAHRERKPGGGW